MATAATQQRLLDAAEMVFAEKGYDGASIRCITASADVDLGAVRYHFGSKDGLFGAVMKRRLGPLCDERLRLLGEIEARYGAAPPPVEEISEAFLLPAVKLVTHPEYGRCWTKLLGRTRIEPGAYLEPIQEIYQGILDRFLAAYARALPELPRDELAYRLYFLFGAEVNTLIDDGTLRAMGEGLPGLREDPRGVCERLIRFVSAGLKTPQPGFRSNPFGTPTPVHVARSKA
jgi:AcrR family transcriptional regulator